MNSLWAELNVQKRELCVKGSLPCFSSNSQKVLRHQSFSQNPSQDAPGREISLHHSNPVNISSWKSDSRLPTTRATFLPTIHKEDQGVLKGFSQNKIVEKPQSFLHLMTPYGCIIHAGLRVLNFIINRPSIQALFRLLISMKMTFLFTR